jgi:hypothetical protein
MNVYRWYSEALNIGGITCANHVDIAREQAFNYLKDKFPWDKEALLARGYSDIALIIWPITDDDDYDTKHPLTVATHY